MKPQITADACCSPQEHSWLIADWRLAGECRSIHTTAYNSIKNSILVGTELNKDLIKLIQSHYTGCNRRNGPNFGRVFLMLNYTEKPQNTYMNGLGDNDNWKLWTSFGSKKDSCQLQFLSIRRSAAGRRVTSPINIPVWCIVLRTVSISMTRMRGTLQLQLMALCHSQVTLVKSTDINITETTYSC